jgi:hypothetical protein
MSGWGVSPQRGCDRRNMRTARGNFALAQYDIDVTRYHYCPKSAFGTFSLRRASGGEDGFMSPKGKTQEFVSFLCGPTYTVFRGGGAPSRFRYLVAPIR